MSRARSARCARPTSSCTTAIAGSPTAGRIDDSWKDESRVTRRELAEAIEALVAGKRPSPEQRPSMGCSIKWRES